MTADQRDEAVRDSGAIERAVERDRLCVRNHLVSGPVRRAPRSANGGTLLVKDVSDLSATSQRTLKRAIRGDREQTGAVTAIQLVGSFANANLHFHTLVPEGVWHERPDGSLGFHALPPPTDEDVEQITARIVARISRLLAHCDGEAVDDEPDALALAQAQSEAVQLPMSLAEPPPRTSASRRRCAFIDGFSLHADTSVDAADRPALERLVRYLLRPLISADRLTARPDGRVEYHFRRSDPSGRTSWVTEGTTWCRRLATLIPPRRSHTTRFHGVLSSAHVWRSRRPLAPDRGGTRDRDHSDPTSMMLACRLDWAALLRSVLWIGSFSCIFLGPRWVRGMAGRLRAHLRAVWM